MTRWTDTIGGPPVTIEYLRGGLTTWETIDCDDVWGDVTITTGRKQASQQPEAATCTFIVRDTDGAWTRRLKIRSEIRVRISGNYIAYLFNLAGFHRFRGRITDHTVEPHPAGGTLLTVTAAGPLGDMGRTYIGDEPWAAESCTVRIQRIVNLAGQTLGGWTSGFFNPVVCARDIDKRSAGELLSEYARDYQGFCFEFFGSPAAGGGETAPYLNIVPDGRRDYFLAHLGETGFNPYLTLDACDVFMASTWQDTIGDVVNEWNITYGDAPAGGGDKPTTKFENAASKTAYGRLPTSVTLNVRDAPDATTWGTTVLGRTKDPHWSMSSLQFDLAHLTKQQQLGWLFPPSAGAPDPYLLELTGVDPAIPVNYKGLLWVEGYTETIGPDGWLVSASVTDALADAWGTPWNNVDPALRWDQMNAAATWDIVDNYLTPVGVT